MRLRFMRNDLFHCVQCAIPQEDFEKRWAKGTELLQRLEAPRASIDKLKPRKFDQMQRTCYVKIIRVQFSCDRPDAEEFIKQKFKDPIIIMGQSGPSKAEKEICTKCNGPKCSDCSRCQCGSKTGDTDADEVTKP